MLVSYVTFLQAVPHRSGMKLTLHMDVDGVELDARDAFLVIREPGEEDMLVPYGNVRFMRGKR